MNERIEGQIQHRHSIRLKEYDYASTGAYFITLCTQNRVSIFGQIIQIRDNGQSRGIIGQSRGIAPTTTVGADPRVCPDPYVCPNSSNNPDIEYPVKMVMNDIGQMISKIWHEIPEHYPGIEIDEFVVMPNHIHGIIVIDEIHQRQYQKRNDGQSQRIAPTTTVGADPRVCPDPRVYPNNIEQISKGISLSTVVQRFKTMTTKLYIEGVKHSGWPPFAGRLWQRNYYEHIIRNDDEWNNVRQYIITNPVNWTADAENPERLPDFKGNHRGLPLPPPL